MKTVKLLFFIAISVFLLVACPASLPSEGETPAATHTVEPKPFGALVPPVQLAAEAPAATDTVEPARRWTLVNGPSYYFSGVRHINDKFVVAATFGNSNVVSRDGGLTWYPFLIGDENEVRLSFFLNERQAWAAVWGKGIYHTNDGGGNWEFLSETGGRADWLFFLDASTGWLSSIWEEERGLYQTTDGGRSWQKKTGYDPSFAPVSDYVFLSRAEGWVAGAMGLFRPESPEGGVIPDMPSYGVYRTQDGGARWTEVKVTPLWGSYGIPSSLSFVDRQNGWIVTAKGEIFRTADGGQTWEKQRGGIEGRFDRVRFIDKDHGWIHVTEGPDRQSLLLRTTNGGMTWESRPYLPDYYINAFHFLDTRRGWAVGAGLVLRSDDGGISWVPVHRESPGGLRAISYVGENETLVSGGVDTVLRSVDGGSRWVAVRGKRQWQTMPGGAPHWGAIHFEDSQNGWIGGMVSDPASAERAAPVMRTEDGGVTWRRQLLGNFHITSLLFVSPLEGWAAGSDLFYTRDGGNTWTRVGLTSGQIYYVTFLDQDRGWLISRDLLYRTVDGGKKWDPYELPRKEKGSGVFPGIKVRFIDPEYGWFLRDNVIFSTEDGGTSWISLKDFSPLYIADFDFIDKSEGWVVGEKGAIFHTRDGGISWERQANPAEKLGMLSGVRFRNARDGIAVGDHGMVLRYSR